MSDEFHQHRKQRSAFSEADWSTADIVSGTPRLATRYDFLNDPDLQKQLVKIKKELQRTRSKLRRKKADRLLLTGFMFITTAVVALLFVDQENIHSVSSLSALVIYFFVALIMLYRVLRPMSLDIRYLREKTRYLSGKKKETADRLRAYHS